MKRKTQFVAWKPDCTVLKTSLPDYQKNYNTISSYLRTEVDNKTLKKETIQWLKNSKKSKTEIAKIQTLEDWRFAVFGKLCYILNNGGEIPLTGPKFMEKMLKEYIEVSRNNSIEEAEEVSTIYDKSIQDYLKDKATTVINDLDVWIEKIICDSTINLKEFEPLKTMRSHDLKQGHARYIIKFYENDFNELKKALTGNDDELNKAYQIYSRSHLKKIINAHEVILDAAKMVIDSKKAERKPRKKKIKAKDPVKLTSKVKFLKEDITTGLVSVNLSETIAAQQLWCYNSKTRKLGLYVSKDEVGLSFKGTTVLNYDESKSLQKTLRKPAEQIKLFKGSTPKKMQNEFDAIRSTETKINGRTNQYLVIFRVIK